MLPETIAALTVFAVVALVIFIRYATQYSPESALRRWVTRVAVAAITLWLVRYAKCFCNGVSPT